MADRMVLAARVTSMDTASSVVLEKGEDKAPTNKDEDEDDYERERSMGSGNTTKRGKPVMADPCGPHKTIQLVLSLLASS